MEEIKGVIAADPSVLPRAGWTPTVQKLANRRNRILKSAGVIRSRKRRGADMADLSSKKARTVEPTPPQRLDALATAASVSVAPSMPIVPQAAVPESVVAPIMTVENKLPLLVAPAALPTQASLSMKDGPGPPQPAVTTQTKAAVVTAAPDKKADAAKAAKPVAPNGYDRLVSYIVKMPGMAVQSFDTFKVQFSEPVAAWLRPLQGIYVVPKTPATQPLIDALKSAPPGDRSIPRLALTVLAPFRLPSNVHTLTF